MIVVYKMSSSKKEKMLDKVENMIDALEEIKHCFKSGEEMDERDEEEYYRRNYRHEDMEPSRYRYRRGM